MRHKKLLLFPFAGLTVLTLSVATAFACTIFKGTFTVKGNASSTKITSTGLGNGMNQTVSGGGDAVAQATSNGGSVTVWTGKDADGRKLPRGTYLVRFYNSTDAEPGYTDHANWSTDCMVGSPGTTLGPVEVNKFGKIKGQPLTFALPSGLRKDTPPEESTVCISDTAAVYGNQAPLTVV